MGFTPSSAGLNAVSDVGKVVSGIGNIVSAQNATAMGSYNANISLQQAQAQQQSFDLTLQEYQAQSDELLSQDQDMYAKSGVAFKGSPVDSMLLDLTNVNMNEAIMTYNNNIKVQNLQNQAALERYTAAQTAAKDYTSGALSLLGGGLDLAKEIGGNTGPSYTISPESVLG
jgi:hypothetical protein